MWTDSTTVIQWLGSLDKQPIFVANRVPEILESTTVDQWFLVPTSDNPADGGTRGMCVENLQTSSWLTGPSFLLNPHFPFQPSTSIKDSLQTKSSSYNSHKDVTAPEVAFAVNTTQSEKRYLTLIGTVLSTNYFELQPISSVYSLSMLHIVHQTALYAILISFEYLSLSFIFSCSLNHSQLSENYYLMVNK